MKDRRTAETSLMAYDPDFMQSVRAQVALTVMQATHPSSSDVSRISGIPRTTVCGRLRELEDEGVICKAGRKVDPFTKKTVSWYAL